MKTLVHEPKPPVSEHPQTQPGPELPDALFHEWQRLHAPSPSPIPWLPLPTRSADSIKRLLNGLLFSVKKSSVSMLTWFIRRILARPALKAFASMILEKFPAVFENLRRFNLRNKYLTQQEPMPFDGSVFGPGEVKSEIWVTSRRAKRIHSRLQEALPPTGPSSCVPSSARPKMAYVSPFPPEKCGIGDYSAELLPELSRHYDIEIISPQDTISDPWVKKHCPLRGVAWFKAHANEYDRVLYHFGNSHFHQHMFELLAEVPGVVVLHDFFLSGVLFHLDSTGTIPGFWAQNLYRSHGYGCVQERYYNPDPIDLIVRYPCNLDVVQNALGVIVHSPNSKHLAQKWHGQITADDWALIPHLRACPPNLDRAEARLRLGWNPDDFVVCSFGFTGFPKQNHRLLDVWLTSGLAQDPRCSLVFVGENSLNDYGQSLITRIMKSGMKNRIRITGWVDPAAFREYLTAADVAVQLRTASRGETSGTVLDCMNYGLPTIVNAHGSMADLPEDSVLKIPDEFKDDELKKTLETLRHDKFRRNKLGVRAREIIRTRHDPRACALQYHDFIESTYKASPLGVPACNPSEDVRAAICAGTPSQAQAEALALAFPSFPASSQWFLDVTELVTGSTTVGVQRGIGETIREWLTRPPEGFKVEPVYFTDDGRCLYARRFTLRLLDCPDWFLEDEPVEFRKGDIFFGEPSNTGGQNKHQGYYDRMRQCGVSVRLPASTA